VKHTLYDEISERYPATVIRRHPKAILFLDGDSAAAIATIGRNC
jgi:glucosamine-6-phosphate deaminase